MSIMKILIIDDDPAMTKLIGFLLREGPFNIHAVHSGEKGIEAARKLDFDVIILDLMMPGIDGWEVCRRIRTFSQVPILVLTVIAKSEQAACSLKAGANDFLTKPVTRKVLISHLNKLTGKAHKNS